MKITTIIILIALSLFVVIAINLINSPKFIWGNPQYHEEQRLTSPDGRVDAILVTMNYGAMDSAHYWVYVVPVGLDLKNDIIESKFYKPVFQAQKLSGLSLAWEKPQLLHIEYNAGYIYGFNNREYPFQEEYDYVVNIKETCRSL